MARLQLYGTASATGTSVAQVTIPATSRIRAIQADIMVDSNTDAAQVRLELSKVPTNQIATNGALDPIAEFAWAGNLATSGLGQGGINQQLAVDVPCRQGEIIYLHATVSGTATFYANFILIYG